MTDMMTPEEFVYKYNMRVSYVKFVEPVVTSYEYLGEKKESTSYKFRFELTGYDDAYDWEDEEENPSERTLSDTYEVEWTYTVGVAILLREGVLLPNQTLAEKFINSWHRTKTVMEKEAFDHAVILRTTNPKYLFQPKILDILYSLQSDFSSVEGSRHFEDWASDFGYDPDSRKAEAIYKTIEANLKEFKWRFGEAVYKELLKNTDWSEY